MAWPFNGAWEGRTADNLAEILSALFIAVNERLALTTQPEVSFITGSGGSTTSPTPADLAGLDINGVDMNTNFATMNAGFGSFYSKKLYTGPVEIFGNDAGFWGGRVMFWDGDSADEFPQAAERFSPRDSIVDTALHVGRLNNWREDLDRLTKCVWFPMAEGTGIVAQGDTVYGDGDEGGALVLDEAWADALGNQRIVTFGGSIDLGLSGSLTGIWVPPISVSARAGAAWSYSFTIYSDAIVGDVMDSAVWVDERGTGGQDATFPHKPVYFSGTQVASLGVNNPPFRKVNIGGGSIPAGTFFWELPEGGDNPFGWTVSPTEEEPVDAEGSHATVRLGLIVPNSTGVQHGDMQTITVYTDVASLLTDQQ